MPLHPLAARAADGTELACWDLGGVGTPLLMAHGTSLHGRCWSPLAEALPPGLAALGLDMRGHGASQPSADGLYPWERFATDILAVVDQLGLGTAPGLVGVGHSAGGASLLLAESMRPGTFARLWVWEPILSVPGSDLRLDRSAELAARARRRRSQFPSLEEARQYLEGRGMFAEFSPPAFEAFLNGAFKDAPRGGLELACDPEIEARVYEAAPHHGAWDGLSQVKCPVRLLGGRLSPAVPPEELTVIGRQLEDVRAQVFAGLGHFGPFQGPGELASDLAGWAVATTP